VFWAAFFEVKQRWPPFLPGFQDFCQDFQQIKTFGVACIPPPAVLLFIAVSG